MLEPAPYICLGMLLSTCSGKGLHLGTLQKLVVSLRSIEEAEVQQFLPLIFGVAEHFISKELDFNQKVFVLGCLDLLIAHGRSSLLVRR